MAARVTDTEVKEIITVPTSVDLTTFINLANLVVNEQLVGQGLTDDMLTKIELWLSAHYAAQRYERGGLTSNKLGDSSAKYKEPIGSGLSSTRYGEQAVALDTTGLLATLNKSGTARFTVV